MSVHCRKGHIPVFTARGEDPYRSVENGIKAAENLEPKGKAPWGNQGAYRSRSQSELCKVNPQIIIDVDLDLVLEGVCLNFKLCLFQEVNENTFFARIYDPVF